MRAFVLKAPIHLSDRVEDTIPKGAGGNWLAVGSYIRLNFEKFHNALLGQLGNYLMLDVNEQEDDLWAAVDFICNDEEAVRCQYIQVINSAMQPLAKCG